MYSILMLANSLILADEESEGIVSVRKGHKVNPATPHLGKEFWIPIGWDTNNIIISSRKTFIKELTDWKKRIRVAKRKEEHFSGTLHALL